MEPKEKGGHMEIIRFDRDMREDMDQILKAIAEFKAVEK